MDIQEELRVYKWLSSKNFIWRGASIKCQIGWWGTVQENNIGLQPLLGGLKVRVKAGSVWENKGREKARIKARIKISWDSGLRLRGEYWWKARDVEDSYRVKCTKLFGHQVLWKTRMIDSGWILGFCYVKDDGLGLCIFKRRQMDHGRCLMGTFRSVCATMCLAKGHKR